jgi:7,8-dihydropterin-6-yl-methyl-4-(beta-D-ribofuranosyl)aminobenzene 5'-phosphate synthase
MSDGIRITILIDDKKSRPDLNAEHGLSLWIEYGDKRILFDTGQSNALVGNAEKLGIDLAQTDAIVLSHGHYDHTGGLAAVLDIAAKAKVYLHPSALEPKFSRKGAKIQSIGMPETAKKALKGRHIIWTITPARLFSGIAVTGQIPRKNNFEDVGGAFFLDKDCQKDDDLPDDQSLYIESKSGIFVVLGCAHAGVVNILNYIAELAGRCSIYGIIGGMHLLNAASARISKTLESFKKFGIRKIAPLHCTGMNALNEIEKSFQDRFLSLKAGAQISFEQ